MQMQPAGDGEQDCCQLATHAGNGVGVRTTDTARERGVVATPLAWHGIRVPVGARHPDPRAQSP
jgi:hypothetical protein